MSGSDGAHAWPNGWACLSGARGHVPVMNRAVALTRAVPASIVACELTHLRRVPIDLDRARREHAAYEQALAALGCEIRRLPPRDDLPDSVFVEDTAVVLDEVAVLTRPGAESRRSEVPSMRAALAPLRPVVAIEPPGTLDGGDVLALDEEIVVGLSERTNAEGAAQLARHVASSGWRARAVPVTGCLHLKSGVTRIGKRTLLVNPRWIDVAELRGRESLECHPDEPFAANALWVGDAIIHAAEFPLTRAIMERAGHRVVSVPAGELARAEGGVTCCSVLVRLGQRF